jgi:type IV secretory pathway VirB4 component
MQPNNQTPVINPGGPTQQAPTTTPAQAPPTQQRQPAPQSSANLNSTQNSLEIAAIRDGIVIMKDGSFRSVVMAKSINFDLMSQSEQEAVEYAYQGFLNSLYFDLQIFIRSRKIDMGPYLEKLSKVRTDMDNMLLGMLMEDYVFFIEDLVQQTNIMSKEFYIVVPFFNQIDAGKALQSGKKLFSGIIGGEKKSIVTIDESALEKAKTELTNRVQNVVNGLIQMSVQAIPLDTQELIELYYNAYNPDTATRQTLKQAEQLTVPMVTKGEGHAPRQNLSEVV